EVRISVTCGCDLTKQTEYDDGEHKYLFHSWTSKRPNNELSDEVSTPFVVRTRALRSGSPRGVRILGHRTAVDDNDLAVHKAVAVAAHEGGVFRELLRPSQSSL